MFMKFLINCALACAPPVFHLGYGVYVGSGLSTIDVIWTLWAGLIGLVLVFASHYMKTEKEQGAFAKSAAILALSLLLMARACGLHADMGILGAQAGLSAAWTMNPMPPTACLRAYLSWLIALQLLALPLTMPILRMLRMSRSKRSGRLKAVEMLAGNMAYAGLDLVAVLFFLPSLTDAFVYLMLPTLLPATSVAVGNLLLPKRYFFFSSPSAPNPHDG